MNFYHRIFLFVAAISVLSLSFAGTRLIERAPHDPLRKECWNYVYLVTNTSAVQTDVKAVSAKNFPAWLKLNPDLDANFLLFNNKKYSLDKNSRNFVNKDELLKEISQGERLLIENEEQDHWCQELQSDAPDSSEIPYIVGKKIDYDTSKPEQGYSNLGQYISDCIRRDKPGNMTGLTYYQPEVSREKKTTSVGHEVGN